MVKYEDGYNFLYGSDGMQYLPNMAAGVNNQEWHGAGEKFSDGEIVSIYLDLSKGHIKYFINGVYQGSAYSHIRQEEGIFYIAWLYASTVIVMQKLII